MVIEEGFSSTAELDEAECFFIAYFKFVGCSLVNGTSGGDGVPGAIASPEARAKMRRAGLRPENLIKLQQMAARNRGRSISAAHRERIRSFNQGRRFSDAHRARLRAAHQKPERKALLRRTLGGPKPTLRKAVMDQHGVVYESISAAAAVLGLRAELISAVIHGRIRHTGGFTFTLVRSAPENEVP
ncbi:hypothetical protein HPP06_28880 [Corallococcus exiguus]|nr:hypothetical protein [Corallococcus exiguus]